MRCSVAKRVQPQNQAQPAPEYRPSYEDALNTKTCKGLHNSQRPKLFGLNHHLTGRCAERKKIIAPPTAPKTPAIGLATVMNRKERSKSCQPNRHSDATSTTMEAKTTPPNKHPINFKP